MVWWLVLAEIYLVVDYLGLIHVLSNLDLKLLMISCMVNIIRLLAVGTTTVVDAEVERTKKILKESA
jgi:hypothetical protein